MLAIYWTHTVDHNLSWAVPSVEPGPGWGIGTDGGRYWWFQLKVNLQNKSHKPGCCRRNPLRCESKCFSMDMRQKKNGNQWMWIPWRKALCSNVLLPMWFPQTPSWISLSVSWASLGLGHFRKGRLKPFLNRASSMIMYLLVFFLMVSDLKWLTEPVWRYWRIGFL